MSRWRVIDGCACPASIAPYWAMVLRDAGLTAASIYRGDDPTARRILNAHGKHTQRQLAQASPRERAAWKISGTPNRPGEGTHELRSDGRARKGPPGRRLQEWEQPVDAGANTEDTRRRLKAAAHKRGWQIEFPYDAVVEYHHAQFAKRPRPRGPVQLAKLVALRARLPRK